MTDIYLVMVRIRLFFYVVLWSILPINSEYDLPTVRNEARLFPVQQKHIIQCSSASCYTTALIEDAGSCSLTELLSIRCMAAPAELSLAPLVL
uniref:Uncharacterized protein n=1 Tax=Xenopus tropicalis TaxID=8364 RepID=A0A1B8YAQ5_XENTR